MMLLTVWKTMTQDAAQGESAIFPQTRWSLIGKLREPQSPETAKALDEICRVYWYPLYVYARRFGLAEPEAKDAVQELFLQMLEGNKMAQADQARGRLRTFLLACLQNVIRHGREKAAAAKRGAGYADLSIHMEDAEGRYLHDVESKDIPPDRAFERKWVLELLHLAKEHLREHYARRGKLAHFVQLEGALLDSPHWDGQSAAAAALGVSEETVKVAIHRMRKRYREMLVAEVARLSRKSATSKMSWRTCWRSFLPKSIAHYLLQKCNRAGVIR